MMRYLRKLLWGLALALFLCPRLPAQELLPTVRITAEQLGTVGANEFTLLEQQLRDWLTYTPFTSLRFAQRERIPCSFSLNILERTEDYKYKAELVVSAQRTAFNTNYTTSIALFRDRDVDFEYVAGSPLETNLQSLSSNLIATLAFYAYYLIALNLDSYSPEGGSVVLPQLTQLQGTARGQSNWSGWESFAKDENRAALLLSIEQEHSFRQLWYTYHRRGLDVLAEDMEQGRSTIREQIKALIPFQREHFRSPMVSLWIQTKIDEVVGIFSEAPKAEREEIYKLLQDLAPTKSDSWSKLRH